MRQTSVIIFCRDRLLLAAVSRLRGTVGCRVGFRQIHTRSARDRGIKISQRKD